MNRLYLDPNSESQKASSTEAVEHGFLLEMSDAILELLFLANKWKEQVYGAQGVEMVEAIDKASVQMAQTIAQCMLRTSEKSKSGNPRTKVEVINEVDKTVSDFLDAIAGCGFEIHKFEAMTKNSKGVTAELLSRMTQPASPKEIS